MPSAPDRSDRFTFVRPGIWIAPLIYLAFALMVCVGAEDGTVRLVFVVLAAIFVVWAVRALRVSVETTDRELVVRTSYRTTRFSRTEVADAEARPARTISPRAKGYSALTVYVTDGRARQFDDLSVSEAEAPHLAAVVDHINSWRLGELR